MLFNYSYIYQTYHIYIYICVVILPCNIYSIIVFYPLQHTWFLIIKKNPILLLLLLLPQFYSLFHSFKDKYFKTFMLLLYKYCKPLFIVKICFNINKRDVRISSDEKSELVLLITFWVDVLFLSWLFLIDLLLFIWL